MTERTVRVDGSGQDGLFVWWEPGPMRVESLRQALTDANCSHLLPKASTVPAALKTTLAGYIESAKIKERGSPIALEPLRDDVRGFEAVKVQRGDVNNDHCHVMSIVLDSITNRVEIVRFDPDALPHLSVIKDQIEDKMTEVFHEQMDYFPTAMVSGCLSRAISHMGGILVRRAGGIYFLPDGASGRFEPLARALDGSGGGVSVTITRFDLKPGDRSYRLVLDSLRQEVSEALLEIEQGLAELGSSKPRANGQATRLSTLDALNAKVTEYEALLGVTMQDMHSAVEQVRAAVAARNVMEMCV